MGEAVVLTSENSHDFYVKRLGLDLEPAAAPSKEGEPAVESDHEAASDEAGDQAASQQNPNPDPEVGKQKVNARFSELTEQRKAAEAKAVKAEAEAKAAHEARALAEKRAADAEAKLAPPPAADEELGPEPKPEQFKDGVEYAKALAEWSTDKAFKERDAKEAETRAQAERQKVEDTFKERQTAFIAKTPDYESALEASPLRVHNEVRDAILESDVGPQLLHHLATNPDVAARFQGTSIRAQLKEIGKLEAKLAVVDDKSAPAAEPGKSAVAAQEISRAPAPITPLKGANAPAGVPIDSKGEFYGTAAEWKALRKAGKIK